MPLDSSYLQVSDGLQDAALMHITNSRSIGATTIEVDTVSGIPAKFIAAYGTLLPPDDEGNAFIDPATMRNFYGHLSGSNLEIDGFLPGSADNGNTDGQVVVIKPNTFWANLIAEMAVEAEENIDGLLEGWIPSTESWTYVSYDNAAGGATSANGVSTGVIYVAGDQTSKYSPGMRVKFTQTTLRQGIITAVSSYDAGNDRTTLTVFFGTDYTLSNATIVTPYYSSLKAPQGFPLNPEKWTVEMADNTTKSQANPTQNTIYNIGSLQITAPIGSFEVGFKATVLGSKSSSTGWNFRFGFAEANNSTPDPRWAMGIVCGGATGTVGASNSGGCEYLVSNATKQAYYFNAVTFTSGGMSSISIDGLFARTIFYARCAHL